MKRKIVIGILLIGTILTLNGCVTKKSDSTSLNNDVSKSNIVKTNDNATATDVGELKKNDVFTDRDLNQDIDTKDAKKYTVKNNENITITDEGTYIISGSAENAQVVIDTEKEAKVQLIFDNLIITNENSPCIYVKSADKVFISLIGTNSLSVNEAFISAGDTNTDAVIFSKEDLVINGEGTLKIVSTDNGITSKDDLKITGGTIDITCVSDALEANDSIAIANGNITINSKKDGLHAEDSDDNSVGYIYISGGVINITASDDAIHATTIVQIDGGTITANSNEGIEGTNIQINDGIINITASDDGINSTNKSNKYSVATQINGGNIKIKMGNGDTDGIDSNGNLYINGGTIDITANSPFDYDDEAKYTGGTIIINGEITNTITNQMMGGGHGGMQNGNRDKGQRGQERRNNF